MPSTMIHLYTGTQFIKTSNLVKDKAQFYLGCIAPDAINLEGFAEKEVRWSAHLRQDNLDEWEQRAIDFYIENRDKINHDYLLGYLLHVFTDIAWDKKYDAIIWQELNKTDLPQEQKLDERWNEFFYYDKTKFNTNWWKNEITPMLKQAKAVEFNDISAEQITKYLEFVVYKYDQTIEPILPKIITNELIESFSYYAVAMLKNEL